ncbi:ATP-dependent nuclease [Helicobacter cetorum]|uniref:ATP-dependent nuclease n=1 Tax=Helicobacter cetorum TaxID=138563 RepID=UPI000CF19862|nr:AAA family ATPase [Helicobacter cetorum]
MLLDVQELNYSNVFKNIALCDDKQIALNKKGSGIKRLVLLSFFITQAQNIAKDKKIIFAIEEIENAQSLEHQKKLVDFLKSLIKSNSQIILTTHSPFIVRLLDLKSLRIVSNKIPYIKTLEKQVLPFSSNGAFLSEVNFLAFNIGDETYHNELYGHIEMCQKMDEYKKLSIEKHSTKIYTRLERNEEKKEAIDLSTFIRHQIHHPENNKNTKYTNEELQTSIEDMREFLMEIDKETK